MENKNKSNNLSHKRNFKVHNKYYKLITKNIVLTFSNQLLQNRDNS